jgi:hypothetical protein
MMRLMHSILRTSSWLVVLGCLALAACDSTVEDGAGGAGGAGAGGDGDGGGADACQEASDCPSSTVNPTCAYVDGSCGEAAGKTCTETGPSCGESLYATFCACDGTTFAAPRSCVTERDERPGACPPPEGRFFCGAIDCAVDAEYCDLSSAAASCAAVPTECEAAPDLCLCLGFDGSGGCDCTVFDDGHAEVACYFI